MSADNVQLIRRWVEVGNRRDGAALAEFYSDDASYSSPKGQTRGKAALTAAFRVVFETTPDITTEVVRLFGDGSDVVAEIVVKGTTVRPHPSYKNAIAGRSFVNPQVHLFRIEQGKIVSNVVYYDYANMVRQLT